MIRKLADEWDDEDEDTEHETLNEIIPKVDKEVRNDISTPSGGNDDLVPHLIILPLGSWKYIFLHIRKWECPILHAIFTFVTVCFSFIQSSKISCSNNILF